MEALKRRQALRRRQAEAAAESKRRASGLPPAGFPQASPGLFASGHGGGGGSGSGGGGGQGYGPPPTSLREARQAIEELGGDLPPYLAFRPSDALLDRGLQRGAARKGGSVDRPR